MCGSVLPMPDLAKVFARLCAEFPDPPQIPATNRCQTLGITKRLTIRRWEIRGDGIMSIQSTTSAELLLGAIAPSIEIVALMVIALPVALFFIVLLLALRHAARGMQARGPARGPAPRVMAQFGMPAPQRSLLHAA